jgi:hypothetical protein
MRRRPEAYHETLVAADSGEVEQQEAGEGAVSIHDLIKVNEPGISKRLWYDAYERRSGLVHILPVRTTPEQFEQAAFDELGDFVSGPFEVAEIRGDRVVLERIGTIRRSDGTLTPLRVRKAFAFGADRRVPTLDLSIDVTNEGSEQIDALVGVEFALNMLGGGGNPAAWYAVGGDRGGFDQRRVAQMAHHVSLGNSYIGVELESRPQPAAAAWWSSIETISVSESGFEGNHQGGCLLWVWPLRVAPGETISVTLANLVRTFVDRAEEEGL